MRHYCERVCFVCISRERRKKEEERRKSEVHETEGENSGVRGLACACLKITSVLLGLSYILACPVGFASGLRLIPRTCIS